VERDVVSRNPPRVGRGQIGGLRLALLGCTHPTTSRIPLDPDEVYHALWPRMRASSWTSFVDVAFHPALRKQGECVRIIADHDGRTGGIVSPSEAPVWTVSPTKIPFGHA
jgi:hypothetical protein